MTIGYLLVGHGTRSPAGQAQFRQVYGEFAHLMAPEPTELAFLELADPDIPSAIRKMAEKGVRSLVTVPVLLFSAGHAQRDIPDAVSAAAQQFSLGVEEQMPALGCCDPMVELSALRFREAVCQGVTVAGELHGCGNMALRSCQSSCLGDFCSRTGLAMIGRGSKSESATRDMRHFAELRHKRTPVAWLETGFIHGQQPDAGQALDALAACEFPIAVVQPHLLFEGQLMVDLREEVARRQRTQPAKRWVITQSLGTDSSLATTLAAVAKASFVTAKPMEDERRI